MSNVQQACLLKKAPLSAAGLFLTVSCLQRYLAYQSKTSKNDLFSFQEHPDLAVKF